MLFTIVDPGLRTILEETLRRARRALHLHPRSGDQQPGAYLNATSRPSIGGQHVLNADYFKRIEALNFTMAHDDGQHPQASRRRMWC